LLRRHLGGIEGRQLTMTFLKILAAALAMGAAAWYAQAVLRSIVPGGSIPIQAVRVTGAIAIGLGVLAAAATLLRVREFHEARDLVLGRLRRLRR
jgi:peptidoglycan biosynthesis protein MviN/MurJ (putative lipid II flippase)